MENPIFTFATPSIISKVFDLSSKMKTLDLTRTRIERMSTSLLTNWPTAGVEIS